MSNLDKCCWEFEQNGECEDFPTVYLKFSSIKDVQAYCKHHAGKLFYGPAITILSRDEAIAHHVLSE